MSPPSPTRAAMGEDEEDITAEVLRGRAGVEPQLLTRSGSCDTVLTVAHHFVSVGTRPGVHPTIGRGLRRTMSRIA